ncbi:MAG: carboxylating nicotinate-nucleotide diphosphorylase [Candidatus Aminicenantales bacterium]
MENKVLDQLIKAALDEDMPAGDMTTDILIPNDLTWQARLMAKEDGVLAGIDIARRVFELVDPAVLFTKLKEDGEHFRRGEILARLRGPAAALLKAERTALNFLQRLSGIATLTARYVAAAGPKTKILDTRKTTPTLRLLEKYAVRMGGGYNHRMNLSEAVLIKDNHRRAVGSISQAVRLIKASVPPSAEVLAEVSSPREAKEALEAGASRLLLDNMSLQEIKQVVDLVKGRVPLEVSGRMNLRRVRQIASLGVDYISVGRLTHSYRSTDISLEFEEGFRVR